MTKGEKKTTTKRLSLSTLAPSPGARSKRIRVGRGEGGGLGKTSGRGGKGQTARTGGGVRVGFEGGQMPLYRRISKYGFRSNKRVIGRNRFDVVNLAELETHFESGAEVTPEALLELGFGRTNRNLGGYKVLGTGKISKKLQVKVHAISASAKSAIEAAGGAVQLIERKPAPAA